MGKLPILRRAAILIAVAALACSESSSPARRDIAELDMVAGDDQEGVVGKELPEPLVVRAIDAAGRPVSGIVINFRVTSGGGSVFAGAAATNEDGIAQERWTLGTSTGTAHALEARAVDARTGEPIVYATFTARPRPDVPAVVEAAGGNGQSGALGAKLADSLEARVTDRYGNLIADVPVAWSVQAGGGAVAAGAARTSAAGVVRAAWTLGAVLDANQTVRAAAVGATPALFVATPSLPPDARLTKLSPDVLAGTVGETTADSLVVRVTLASGQPVAGARVEWSSLGGGTVHPAAERTDADGRVAAALTLGTTKGEGAVRVSVAGLTPVLFTVHALPAAPATITKLDGDGQVADAGTRLPRPLRVRITDRYGNGVSGVEISWTPSAGGIAWPSRDHTDMFGEAAVVWTLGGETTHQEMIGAVAELEPVIFVAQARGYFVRFASIDAGTSHTCGLSTSGGTFCWGWTSRGSLGGGVLWDSATLARPVAGVALTTVLAGVDLSCGLSAQGAALCWGWNDFGQLARGGFGTGSGTPAEIDGGLRFAMLADEAYHVCGVTTGGETYCWGRNDFGQLGAPAGEACGSDGPCSSRPILVTGGHGFRTVATGLLHSCALTEDGEAFCWGYNQYGQLGAVSPDRCGTGGSIPCTREPRRVDTELRFVSLGAGTLFTCGMTELGAVYCWGDNRSGQLGTGSASETPSTTPQLVRLPYHAVRLAVGAEHACIGAGDALTYCWGSNQFGQLGRGTTGGYSAQPEPLPSNYVFSTIVAGYGHNCGLLIEGEAYCWGRGDSGQLGNGERLDRSSPVRVAGGN